MSIKPVHRHMFPVFVQALGLSAPAVEVGVAEGDYAKTFLSLWPFDYYMVDRWRHVDGYDDVMNGSDDEHEARFQKALAVARSAGPRCRILRMDSVQAASEFADRSLSFVYIDGDHSYGGCRRDILAWAPKVMPGGVIAGHDYYDKEPFMVRSAVVSVTNGPCGITHEPSPSWWCHIG